MTTPHPSGATPPPGCPAHAHGGLDDGPDNGGPSQRVAEAGGSPALEAQGAGGSSPDNDGTGRYCQTVRVRQARREGVAEANQWLNPLKRGIGSNLVDMGRAAVHACPDGVGDSGVGISWSARRP